MHFMKGIRRITSYVLSFALLFGMMGGIAAVPAAAASTTHNLATLAKNGQIKLLGRTSVNSDSSGIMTDWSGSGFEINVTLTAARTFTVGYKMNYNNYWAALVDGKQVWRGMISHTKDGTLTSGTFSFTVPAGTHTVSVIKETEIGAYSYKHDLTTLAFDGTINAAPAKKGLYIEFVGDSYSCGDGALGVYESGKTWGIADHSATHSFPWYTAKALNADYSFVSRGGIGLFAGQSAQQSTVTKLTIADVYNYTSGHRAFNSSLVADSSGLYDFTNARKPDIVVVEIGANDTINNSDTYTSMTAWVTKLTSFVNQIRAKNPNAAIICLSHNGAKYYQMKQLANSMDNVYALFYAHNGNGSAALATQMEGHPSWEDHEDIANELVNFIKWNKLIPEAAETAKTYNDIVYYVSASGNDNNNGKTLATAEKTLRSALIQAESDYNKSFPNGSRLVIYVQGEVANSDASVNSQVLGAGNLRTADGSDLPILVTTYNFAFTKTDAVLNTGHMPVNTGNAALYICNDITFKDITIKSYTNAVTGENGVTSYYADYCLYASGYNLVFDNANLITDGKSATCNAWMVSADHFSTGGRNPIGAASPIYGSVTFLNGDYTNLRYVTAVNASHIWRSEADGGSVYSVPMVNAKLVIGEGAIMKNVFSRVGTIAVGSSTVEIRGGTITGCYYGTDFGSETTRKNYAYDGVNKVLMDAGDINVIISGGTINGGFRGTATYVNIRADFNTLITGGTINGGFQGTGNQFTVNGNINNTIEGGTINGYFKGVGSGISGTQSIVNGNVTNNIKGGEIICSATQNTNNISLAAGDYVDINGNVTNTMTSGALHCYGNAASTSTNKLEAEIYFGGRYWVNIKGDLTNKITGGSVAFFMHKGTVFSAFGIYFGTYYGAITGTMKNEIIGGTIYAQYGTVSFGGRTVETPVGKVVNIIGEYDSKGRSFGPRFLINTDSYYVLLAGGWGKVGTSLATHGQISEADCNNNIVVSNTIYGGYIPRVLCSTGNASSTYTSFVKGSVENNIYGGLVTNAFYGAGDARVAGKVTTNVYGGTFTRLYGGSPSGQIYNGVELNVYAMRDLSACASGNNYTINAGGGSSTIKTQSFSKPAVALNIHPTSSTAVVLETPVNAGNATGGTITGQVAVNISGGTYSKAVFDTKYGYTTADIKLTGGTYIANVESLGYCESYAYYANSNGNGTWTVLPRVQAAQVNGTSYATLDDAITAAGKTGTVKLLSKSETEMLRVPSGVKLDLNGKNLTAVDALVFGQIVDGTTGGNACLIISNDASESMVILQADNPQLPIYDSTAGGYRFYSYSVTSLNYKTIGNTGSIQFGFRLLLDNAAGYSVLKNTTDSGASYKVSLEIPGLKGFNINYTYSQSMMQSYADLASKQMTQSGSVSAVFTLTVSGVDTMKQGQTLTATPNISTLCGTQRNGSVSAYSIN